LKAKKAAQKAAKKAALLAAEAAGAEPTSQCNEVQKATGPCKDQLKLTKKVFKPSFAPEV